MGKGLILFTIFLIATIIALIIVIIAYVNFVNEPEFAYNPTIVRTPPRPRRIHTLTIADFLRPETKTPVKNRANVDEYYEKIQKHANDPQNVHDNQILKCMNNKLNVLHKYCQEQYKDNLGLSPEEFKAAVVADALTQIDTYSDTYFAKTNNPDLSRKKYNMAMETIREGHVIHNISLQNDEPNSNPGIEENYVLAMIWTRILHPDNATNREKLSDCLIDQIIDCVEKERFVFLNINIGSNNFEDTHSVVCITGRVSRLLSCLTLLDTDPILAEPEKDNNELENIMYMKAANILKTELLAKNINDLYTKDRDVLNADESQRITKFESETKEKIKNQLTEEYKDILSESILNNIIEKALLGV